MLNGRAICLGVLWILFVAAAFGQDQSDPNIITVTKKIDVAKLNENVEDLNENVATLSKTIDELSKNVKTLNDTVTRLDERTKWIGTLQFVILGAILGGPVVTIFFYRRFGKDSEGTNTVDRLAEQITKLASAQAETQAENSAQITRLISAQAEAQAENSAQITRLISAQAETSATRDISGHPKVPSVEGVDELTDDRRSTPHDATGTV